MLRWKKGWGRGQRPWGCLQICCGPGLTGAAGHLLCVLLLPLLFHSVPRIPLQSRGGNRSFFCGCCCCISNVSSGSGALLVCR